MLKGGWHPERMSLTTDGLALGAAVAIAVGSAVQARQAYTDLNEKTPVPITLGPLLRVAITALFNFLIPLINSLIPWGTVADVSSLFLTLDWVAPTPTHLIPKEVATLTPGEAAVMTADQEKTLAKGESVTLDADQVAAMTAERVKDVRKWLGWLLGWLLILIGALAAVVGAVLTLKNDL